MGWLIAYLVPVVVYFFITYHVFPLDTYHSIPNSVIGFSFPIILFIIFGIIGNVLERTGIIKPVPPNETSPSDTTELDGPELKPYDTVSVTEESRPRDFTYQENHSEALQTAPSAPLVPRQPTIDEMLHTVDLLDGPRFERWCAQLLRKIGFSDVTVTKTSGDQGVDITAVKDDVRYAIQCKCYSSDLGNHPVQEVHAGKSMYGCHVGVVMTNRFFTSGAKDLAKATGTLLWDRNKLKAMLQQVESEIDKRAE